MRCHWTGTSQQAMSVIEDRGILTDDYRYEIATTDAPQWAEAEKQIAKKARSTTVAVPKKDDGERKRKAGAAVEEARKELEKGGGDKDTKGGKRKKQRS